jgi:hypothetical protein
LLIDRTASISDKLVRKLSDADLCHSVANGSIYHCGRAFKSFVVRHSGRLLEAIQYRIIPRTLQAAQQRMPASQGGETHLANGFFPKVVARTAACGAPV